jgi:hypothetical protein
VEVGANFTVKVQFAPGSSAAGQSLVCVKLAVDEMLLIVNGEACLLVSVAV